MLSRRCEYQNTLPCFISRGLLRKAYAVRLFRCIDADEQVSFA